MPSSRHIAPVGFVRLETLKNRLGLNYARYAAEGGAEVPKEPIVFLKAPSSPSGSDDDVVIPKGSQKRDWPVELAVVVGIRATFVRPDEAMEYVAGYCLHNDYSEREFQLERRGPWTRDKSCDSFAPLGPFLATADEIKNAHNLLWLKVNGVTLQDSSTSDLIFRIPLILSYLRQFMTLVPGDVISTGTPEGVGAGLKPPRYLRHGDVVEFGIENLEIAQPLAVAYEEKLKSNAPSACGG